MTLSPESRNLTTFSTHIGVFRYKRLNFGINSAAEIFQNIIRQLLINIPGVINVSDDILVFGINKNEHDKSLNLVLNKLKQEGLTLNKKKCIFSANRIKFFGYEFSEEGFHPDTSKIETILNLKPPQNPSEVRSFLGMVGYVGKFLNNLAENTKHLRNLILKDTEWLWTKLHEQEFKNIKQKLQDVTKLAYYDHNKTTHLFVDAGPAGLGAIITQQGENKNTNIIAYGSRSLTKTEQRYSQIEREMLAISWGIQHFHLYLYGTTFVLHTDSKPLIGILNN